MTGVKRLDKVRNSVVLDSLSMNDLIHIFLSRQLRFLRSDHALYAVYERPTRDKTRRGRPRSITYIRKITGHQLSKLSELSADPRRLWHQLVVECADPQPPE